MKTDYPAPLEILAARPRKALLQEFRAHRMPEEVANRADRAEAELTKLEQGRQIGIGPSPGHTRQCLNFCSLQSDSFS